MKLGENEIKEVIASLPPEVKVAMEKELLGSSKIAINILKALKDRGWSVGEWEDGRFPEDRGFSHALDIEVTKAIDIELEKGGLL
jgi:hypothetical protein